MQTDISHKSRGSVGFRHSLIQDFQQCHEDSFSPSVWKALSFGDVWPLVAPDRHILPAQQLQLTGHVTLPRNPTNTRAGLGHAAQLPLNHIGLVKANQSSIRREEEGDRYQVDSYQVHDSILCRMNGCCNKGPEAGPLMLLQETMRTDPILLVD